MPECLNRVSLGTSNQAGGRTQGFRSVYALVTMPDFLLYGAYGYTGRLIAAAAKDYQLTPLLAGRDAARLQPLAAEFGYDYLDFDLEDSVSLDAALAKVPLVLHAAGPFAITAEPMLEACLRTGTHYLDITGEIEVFARAARLDERAREAGIMLMSGVGFDVVPTDCLAAFLKEQLPDATDLKLAFAWNKGGLSHGTAKTMLRGLGRSGAVRRDGKIIPVPPAYKVAKFPFTADRTMKAVTIPWGDVFTAYHTTGIPNIETYYAVPSKQIRAMKWSRYLGWLFQAGPVQNFLRKRIEARPAGPNAEQRGRAETYVYGEVSNENGERVAARLRTPEGYTLTYRTALEIARRVVGGAAPAGYHTPAGVFGGDFVLGFAGVTRELVQLP